MRSKPGEVGMAKLIIFTGLIFAFHAFSAAQQIIKALPGQTVTLPCQAPDKYFIAVKWTRADLGSDYVIFDNNGKPDNEKQHPTFENRVNLLDKKNEDISLVLTNVSTNDSGTYECQVFQSTKNWKTISTIKLDVGLPAHGNESREDEEKKKKENDGPNGLVVVGVVFAVVVVSGAILFAIINTSGKFQSTSYTRS